MRASSSPFQIKDMNASEIPEVIIWCHCQQSERFTLIFNGGYHPKCPDICSTYKQQQNGFIWISLMEEKYFLSFLKQKFSQTILLAAFIGYCIHLIHK